MASEPGGDASAAVGVAAGATFGRYHTRAVLGVGGMGVVMLADDPLLDRAVAVKVLYGWANAASANQRLMREGQVLARLTHPNVIRVYDVGQDGDTAFVAMEYVRGGTLAAWLAERARSRHEVLEVFLQAGAGLAAAHAAGVVHRDFKPSNVMVEVTGRVLVMDFGLARPIPAPGAEDVAAEARAPVVGGTNLAAGTPGYMSPEQHDGAEVDERSDVFSFCVALWQALFGAPPFAGTTAAEVAAAARQGLISEPPAGRKVPASLRATLARGLRPVPAERWPAMAELLEALRHDPDRRRRRALRATGLAVVAAVLVGAPIAWMSARAAAPVDVCAADPTSFAGIWDPAARVQVREALLATGEPSAAPIVTVVAEALDRKVAAWEAMRRESCEVTKHRHEQSDAAFDLRGACLEQKRAELAAFVDVLRHAAKPTLYHADDAVLAVADVSVCADAVALGRRRPLPSDPQRRAAIAAAETQALRLRVAVELGVPLARPADALELEQTARTLGYPPLTALALYVRARDEDARSHFEAVATLLDEGIVAAELGGDDALRLELEYRLGEVLGTELDRFEDGVRHLDRADALTERLHADRTHSAAVLGARAWTELGRGRVVDAEALVRRALTESAAAAPKGLAYARLAWILGSVLLEADRSQEALPVLDEGLALIEAELGPRHPRLEPLLMARGNAWRHLGDYDHAREDMERGLALSRAAHGPTSRAVGVDLANLGMLAGVQDQLDLSADYLRQALAIYVEAYGPDHSRTLRLRSRLGVTLQKAGRFDEAEAILQDALAGLRRVLGDNHRFVSEAYFTLGELERKRRRFDRAHGYFDAAAATLRASEGPTTKLLRRVYRAIGHTHVDEGQYAAACADFQAALDVTGTDPSAASNRADLELELADALDRAGQHARARALTRHARAGGAP